MLSEFYENVVLKIPYPPNTAHKILELTAGSCSDSSWESIQGATNVYDNEIQCLIVSVPIKYCNLDNNVENGIVIFRFENEIFPFKTCFLLAKTAKNVYLNL